MLARPNVFPVRFPLSNWGVADAQRKEKANTEPCFQVSLPSLWLSASKRCNTKYLLLTTLDIYVCTCVCVYIYKKILPNLTLHLGCYFMKLFYYHTDCHCNFMVCYNFWAPRVCSYCCEMIWRQKAVGFVCLFVFNVLIPCEICKFKTASEKGPSVYPGAL